MEIQKMEKKALSLLSLGHMVTDINQGALPVLLPFIKEALHISYAKAGLILLLANLASSIIQPAFGHLSDRHPQGWFLPGGILLASIAFSLTGFAWNYEVLLLLVILSGIGVATFHPEGNGNLLRWWESGFLPRSHNGCLSGHLLRAQRDRLLLHPRSCDILSFPVFP